MFIVNGEKIDTRDTTNVYAKIIKDGLLELKKKGYPLTFKYVDSLIQKDPDNDNKETYPQPFTLQLIDFKNNEEWRYCKSFKLDNNKEMVFSPLTVEMGRIISVDEQDEELAFFLYYISGRCLEGVNESSSKEKWFKLEDLNKEARKFSEKQKLNADISYYIYSEHSPLKKDDLIKVSKAMLIPTIDTNLDIVKNNLYNNIIGNENSIKQFHSLLTDKLQLENRYSVQEAFDSKMLVIQTNGNVKTVFYKTANGSENRKLCDVPPQYNSSVVKYVHEYYMDNEGEFNMLKDAVRNNNRAKEKGKEDTLQAIIDGKPTTTKVKTKM